MMFFFSEDDFDKPNTSSVNFSRFDGIKLYIQSDEKQDIDVFIVALNFQAVHFSCGMAGVKFV
jgi:hypothetical protein